MATKIVAMVTTLLLSSTLVSAQPSDVPAVPNTSDQQARELFISGQAAYAEGDYELSILRFEQAYKITARSELLFNEANSYERLARYREAADALAKYIHDAPVAEQLSLRKRVARLRERDLLHVRELERQASEKLQAQQKLAAATQSKPVIKSVRWGALALGAGGMVAVGIGVLSVLSARDEAHRAHALCRDQLCPEAARAGFDRASSLATIGAIAIGISVVSFGAGTYLWLRPEKIETHMATRSGGTEGSNHAMAFGIGFHHQF
jgi:tetratricopeptide (TPR) repeat protein